MSGLFIRKTVDDKEDLDLALVVAPCDRLSRCVVELGNEFHLIGVAEGIDVIEKDIGPSTGEPVHPKGQVAVGGNPIGIVIRDLWIRYGTAIGDKVGDDLDIGGEEGTVSIDVPAERDDGIEIAFTGDGPSGLRGPNGGVIIIIDLVDPDLDPCDVMIGLDAVKFQGSNIEIVIVGKGPRGVDGDEAEDIIIAPGHPGPGGRFVGAKTAGGHRVVGGIKPGLPGDDLRNIVAVKLDEIGGHDRRVIVDVEHEVLQGLSPGIQSDGEIKIGDTIAIGVGDT